MNIYRIDHFRSRTHSWFVSVQRRGKLYRRYFSDGIYGGKQKALKAATVYRDSLTTCLQPLTRQEHCSIRKKNNRSGISGVTRIDTVEKVKGQTRRRLFWLAQWPVGNGKAAIKKFSIMRYGEWGAFQRALHARRQALKSLRALSPETL